MSGRVRRASILQLEVIGYFTKISATRLSAFSAAACGTIPPWMMSVQPVIKMCSFWACAKVGL